MMRIPGFTAESSVTLSADTCFGCMDECNQRYREAMEGYRECMILCKESKTPGPCMNNCRRNLDRARILLSWCMGECGPTCGGPS